MRFMVIIKADASFEAGEMPSERLLGEFGKYNELFPELWIYRDRRGYHWLLCPAPVDPPGGQR